MGRAQAPEATASDEARAFLEDGLDALDFGIAIFDDALLLADCNARFRDMRGYPANLCQPGAELRDLLRHDVTHGQLTDPSSDPLEAWLRRAQRRERFVRVDELADGRFIEIRLAPAGRSNLLLCFADVTERQRAEASLRAREEWQELVTEATSEGIYDWNVATGKLTVSYKLTAMLGLSPGELSAADWNGLIHPDDFEAYREAIARHFRGETAVLQTEYRVRRKRGDYIWFADSGKCVREATGRAVRLVGAVADITARKLAEVSLQRSEERYARAMEAINEGVYDWNIDTGETFYSEGVRSALGLEPKQLQSADDWFDRIHPDDRDRWRASLIAHFKGETDRFEHEFRYRGSDGTWRWARQHGIAQTDDQGRAVRMIGATGDITELRAHREAAEEARDHLAKAISAISQGFAIYDAEDRLILCNDEYKKIYPGLDDVLVAGTNYETILRALAGRGVVAAAADDPESWVKSRLELHRNPGPPYDTELSDGRWSRVEWRRTGDGGAVGVFTDITELKKTELELRASEELYELATEAATEGLYDWYVRDDRLMVSDRLNAIIELRSGTLNSREWNDRVHPGDRDHYRRTMLDHFKGETRYLSAEYRIRKGDGTYIWVKDSATSVRDESGRVMRLVGAISDISARKRAEMDLQEAKQRAEDAGLLATEKAQTLEALSLKLSKYLSPQVYSSIFTGAQSVEIDARRKKLTIFFSDIAGFTAIADTLESEELTALLNDYLTEMSRIALLHGATIDKFIGDAILAFFGDPETKGSREDAVACVKMAIAMQRRLRELQAKWQDMGLGRTFELRIGITTGFCTVGNFGSEDRMDYTVVGNEVNRAARLQALGETGGIIMSSETHALVKDEILSEDQGMVTLKGFARPMRAYKVVGIYEELAEAGRIVSLDRPGMRLMMNPEQLADKQARAEALAALEKAAARLRGKG